MNNKNNTCLREHLTRLSLVMLFALLGVTNLFAETVTYAEDVMTMDAFSIKPGETKVVAVNLSNPDALTSLQFDFTLPTGLSCSKVTRNDERLDRDEQTVTLTPQGNNLFRVSILTTNMTPFVGNSGALVYLTIDASSNFISKGKISFCRLYGSDAKNAKFTIKPFDVNVTPVVAHLSPMVTTMSVKPDSSLYAVDMQLTNDAVIYGLQADVTLPEGMTIETKSGSASYKFSYSDRLPESFAISSSNLSANKVRLTISSAAFDPMSGNAGKLFSFNVKANKSLAENTSIIFDNVIVSDKSAVAYDLGSSDTVKVMNTYLAQYVPITNKVNALFSLYNNAVDTIAKYDANVKDSAAIVKAGADIKAKIETMQKAVTSSYGKMTLAADSTSILAPSADIKTAIAKWLVDAAAAQKIFDDGSAKKAANAAANTKLNADIAAAQKAFDAAKATVAADDKDVAAQFAAAETSIQTKIDSLTASVKKQFDVVSLTAESVVDTAVVNKAVAKLLADASVAQKAFEADEAKKAANAAANTKLNAEIAAAQKAFDAAKATVAADDKDVAAQFAAAETSIQTKIDSLTASVKKQFDAVSLTAESVVDTAVVNKAVAKLLADASVAQKAFEADEAKKAANAAANTKLNAEIAAAQKAFDAAKATVAADDKDVAAQFAAAETSIQTKIDSLTASVKKQCDAVSLTAESVVDTAVVNKAVAKLLADASVAQKAFEADEAKKAANAAANTKLNAEIAAAQKAFDAAKATVAADDKDVAAQFAAAETSIQTKIDSLTASVKKQFDAVSLTAESVVDTAVVNKAVAKLLADASVAQKAFEADETKKAANAAANTKLNAEIAAAQKAFDAAKATVAADDKDVAAQFAAAETSIQTKIDSLTASVKKQFDAVSLTAESVVDTAVVNKAVAKLLADASVAQKAFEADEAKKAANAAANTKLNAEIAAAQKAFDAAKATVAADDKDVAAQFAAAETSIQTKIDSLTASVKKQFDAVSLTAESVVDTAVVNKAVAKLLADASVAQKAFEADEAKKAAN